MTSRGRKFSNYFSFKFGAITSLKITNKAEIGAV